MEYILTGREMAEFDNYTIEHIGIPSLVLMENASRAMADVIYKNHKDKRILVIAGTGNNGNTRSRIPAFQASPDSPRHWCRRYQWWSVSGR